MELEASLGYASLSQKKKGRLPWPKDLNIVFLSMKGRSRLYDGLLWAQDRQTGNLLPEHQSRKLCPPPQQKHPVSLSSGEWHLHCEFPNSLVLSLASSFLSLSCQRAWHPGVGLRMGSQQLPGIVRSEERSRYGPGGWGWGFRRCERSLLDRSQAQ